MAHRTSADAVSSASPRLSGRAAFALFVSILMLMVAGSAAPTPLYAVYEAGWGFSPIVLTVVFGVYAVAVLAALLTLGSLSDHIGRRPVVLVGLAVQTLAMVLFVTAHSVPALVGARIVQGLATGGSVGALGAGMLDLDRPRGTIANAVAPPAGTALGALASGLIVELLPWRTDLVYVLIAAGFVGQGLAVMVMAEPSAPRPGALASLRPRFGIPSRARGSFWVVAPTLVAAWAIAAFYLSLGPALVAVIAATGSVALGGFALFVLQGSASVTVLLTRHAEPRRLTQIGAAALMVGVAISLVAISADSLALLLAGTAASGVGFGAGFQGGLRTVLPLARPDERAGVLSAIYVVCYLALALPAVIAGVLTVHVGVLASARAYGVAAILLAAVTLLGLTGGRATSRRQP